ncbi:hypothetical protein LYZ87_13240 [Xanthomonas hortorum pv. vitians]|nr:hypothetical protein [Xanthomonas hortorum pv. vitians]
MTDKKKLHISLTVADVGFGGNTGGSKYFYSFSPDLALACKGQSPLTMVYSFAKEVRDNFQIRSVLTTDSKEQIVHPIKIAIDGRSATVINRNEIATLIFLSFVVEDTDKRSCLAATRRLATTRRFHRDNAYTPLSGRAAPDSVVAAGRPDRAAGAHCALWPQVLRCSSRLRSHDSHMSPYPLSAEVWPLAWVERRRQRSVDRGDIAPIADCSIRSVWVVPAGCVEPSCMFTSHPHAAEVGCLPVRLSVRCRIPTVAFDFGSCAPSSPIRKIAESHVDLAACCQPAGHAVAVAVVTASSTPCPLPTRQALRATALIGVGGRAITCPGRGSLHCQITATHGNSQVTFGRGGLGQQHGPGPAARQFGLGRCRPGTGGQHDDQHEQVSD